jgi:hypothetical protein
LKKKLPDAEKASIPVLGSDDSEWRDVVPLNGIRMRGVRLTNPWIVDGDAKSFVGTVCWRGVTEYFRYEFDGAGPFLHRRILFESAQQWAFQEIREVESEGSQSCWARGPCVGIDDAVMSAELKRLFGLEATVRDCFFGKVAAKGVMVVEDSRKPMKGDANGARRVKKFWNGFGKNKNGQVVNYLSNDEGAWKDKLCDDEKSRNFYVLDLFHFGIKGLDYPLQSNVVDVNLGKKRSPEGDGTSSKKKKAKSEAGDDLPMKDLKIEEGYGIIGSANVGKCTELEQSEAGVVNVFSEMRLYWYEPKRLK